MITGSLSLPFPATAPFSQITDQGGFADNTLQDPHNSSYRTKDESSYWCIIYSKYLRLLDPCNALVFVTFAWSLAASGYEGMSILAGILRIAVVIVSVIFLLFLICF